MQQKTNKTGGVEGWRGGGLQFWQLAGAWRQLAMDRLARWGGLESARGFNPQPVICLTGRVLAPNSRQDWLRVKSGSSPQILVMGKSRL